MKHTGKRHSRQSHSAKGRRTARRSTARPTAAQAALVQAEDQVAERRGARQQRVKAKVKDILAEAIRQYADEKEVKALVDSLHAKQHPPVQPVVYTAEQKQDAKALLADPGLFSRYVSILREQVSGQVKIIKAVILMLAGRLVVRPASPCSSNLCVQGTSGHGKSYLCQHLFKTLPDDQIETCGRLSPTAIAYDHAADPEWTWDGKALLVNDIGNSVLNDPCMKLFLSGETGRQKITYEGKVAEIIIRGKPTVIVNLVRAHLDEELRRRIARVTVSVSTKEVEAIFARAADFAMGKTTPQKDYALLQCANSLLQRVEVTVPYAGLLRHWFESRMELLPAYLGFLDLCKASAALHQFQRERDPQGNVIATGRDYELACSVFSILRFGADPADRLKEGAESRAFSLLQEHGKPMTADQLAAAYDCEAAFIRNVLGDLEKRGLVIRCGGIPSAGRPANLWKLNPALWEIPELPDFKELTGQNE